MEVLKGWATVVVTGAWVLTIPEVLLRILVVGAVLTTEVLTGEAALTTEVLKG